MKVDCCGLMRGAGVSTAFLLSLSLSLSGLPPLPPTVPHFVSLLSFPRLLLIYCRNVYCRSNYMEVSLRIDINPNREEFS